METLENIIDGCEIRLLKNSSNTQVTYKSVRISFGDGYKMTRPKGINDREVITPIFFVTTLAGKSILEDFLNAVGNYKSFLFNGNKQLVNSPVSTEYLGGNAFNVSFEVIQYYGN